MNFFECRHVLNGYALQRKRTSLVFLEICAFVNIQLQYHHCIPTQIYSCNFIYFTNCCSFICISYGEIYVTIDSNKPLFMHVTYLFKCVSLYLLKSININFY